jgi:hypothetical protein
MLENLAKYLYRQELNEEAQYLFSAVPNPILALNPTPSILSHENSPLILCQVLYLRL